MKIFRTTCTKILAFGQSLAGERNSYTSWRVRQLRRLLGETQTFVTLRREYEKRPSKAVGRALQDLMGTSTPFADVQKAMQSDFELDYYLLSNPDVRKSGVDGELHYLLRGWKEHRDASRFFRHSYYINRNRRLRSDAFALADYALQTKQEENQKTPPINRKWFTPRPPADDVWTTIAPATRQADTRAVVILPVFKGYDESLAAIYHALHARDGDPYSLLVVNDRSPDQKLTEKLRLLASQGLFEFHESEVNLGFVQTINFALENLSGNLDVVLLNSDAYVFKGWFRRLIRHADIDKMVATITPLSNNATICSYPHINTDNFRALEVDPERLDQLCAKCNFGQSVETPTGVGFCFFIRRQVIHEVGALDAESFKVGYGEENDFCMRSLQAGYKHLIIGDVFVFHVGSVSFSSQKDKNFSDGQSALSRKHPNYARLVRNHTDADPERFMRRNLDAIRIVEQFQNCTMFVSHDWSGGIETFIEHRRQMLRRAGKKSIILRVHSGCLFTIETPQELACYTPNLHDLDLRTEWQFLIDFIGSLGPERIHLNSLAGLDWVRQKQFLDATCKFSHPVTFVAHDYSAITNQYHLLRPDNVYVGTPDASELRKWNLMKNLTPSVDACDPQERHETYRLMFDCIDRVEVPSQSALDIFLKTFPSLKAHVVPHEDHLPATRVAARRPDDGRLRVAVVGAISVHKGSDVLAGLAAYAQSERLPIDYYLVGYSNDDDTLEKLGVVITGLYGSEDEAVAQLDELQPDLILIPSIWPETFCYTLSIAMKKKIPPVVFDLGAQSERVTAIDWGVVLPYHLNVNPGDLSNVLLALPVNDLWAKRSGKSELEATSTEKLKLN